MYAVLITNNIDLKHQTTCERTEKRGRERYDAKHSNTLRARSLRSSLSFCSRFCEPRYLLSLCVFQMDHQWKKRESRVIRNRNFETKTTTRRVSKYTHASSEFGERKTRQDGKEYRSEARHNRETQLEFWSVFLHSLGSTSCVFSQIVPCFPLCPHHRVSVHFLPPCPLYLFS